MYRFIHVTKTNKISHNSHIGKPWKYFDEELVWVGGRFFCLSKWVIEQQSCEGIGTEENAFTQLQSPCGFTTPFGSFATLLLTQTEKNTSHFAG